MHDLTILALIWVIVFLASYLAHKSKLTPVLWFLFFGSLFVNIGLLPKEMPEFIESFGELGIIVIMFAIGFEEDTGNFLSSVKRSWGIALFGALIPFLITFSMTYYFWEDFNVALLCGLALTATAVSITLVSLRDAGLNNTPAATGIMSSAVIDDIASLALVAILIPITLGESTSVFTLGIIVFKAVLFFGLVSCIGIWIFPKSSGLIQKLPIIGYFDLQRMLFMAQGQYMILSLLLVALLVGIGAEILGFHPAVGAYMAGLVIRREYFQLDPDEESHFYSQAKEIIDNAAYSWIGPVFFVTLGAKLIFDGELLLQALPLAVLLFILLFSGQILSAGMAARFTGNFSWQESWLIGIGMLGRAELAFVVLDIAFVEHGIITEGAFYTIMLTIFLLNCSVPFMINWWKRKYQDQVVHS